MATDSNFKHLANGLNLVPNATTLVANPGDIDYSTNTGQFNFYLAGGADTIAGTSSTQTFTNKTLNVTTNSIVGTVGTVAQFDPSTGNLESSSISTTVLGYLTGVTSNIQTQLNGKQSSLTFADSLVNTAGTITLVGDTASPGASMYYGTNASSVLGYYAVQSGLTFSDSLVNTSGNVTLKGDTASPGATQYYGTNGSSVLGYYNIPSTGVTSVALAAPSIFTVSGSPVTSSGTLTLSYSGTALPAVNGGTGLTSFTANSLLYANSSTTLSQVAPGTTGQVLTMNGSGVPQFMAAPGTVSAFFASSQVTTSSSAITSSSFTTFSNSPAFTFTPSISGTYKVYSSVPLFVSSAGETAIARIFNTSGSATLLEESQGGDSVSGATVLSSAYIQSVYTLTAGVSYQFDIQGRNAGAGNVIIDGLDVPFYMFAELEVVANTPPSPTYFNGYTPQGPYWSTTSPTFVDPTNGGSSSSLTTRESNGITVTQAAGDLPGITFTPSANAVYFISATINGLISNTSTVTSAQLTDGTNVISTTENVGLPNGAAVVLNGIYVPGTTSPVTVKIQLATSSSTGIIASPSGTSNLIEWSIQQLITSGGGGGGGGVSSLNSLTGALTIAAGSGITVTPSGGNTLTIAATGGSGANTSLSNLAPTSINTDLLPEFNNTFNIGGTALSWTNAYINTVQSVGTTTLTLATANQSGATVSGDISIQTGNTFGGTSGNIFITPGTGGSLGSVSITGNGITLDSTVRLGANSTTPTHTLNTASTTGSGSGTFTNVPGGAGNPAGYISIIINGTASYIPYFQ